MDDNITYLFGNENDTFGKAYGQIAEHIDEYATKEGASTDEIEEVCISYIAAAARLWAGFKDYPHVQNSLAHIAVELERLFED